jgi:hypothetical protein
MKHLKKINEWKEDSPENRRIDEENINEINDFFLELKDLGCKLSIDEVSTFIEQSYQISYYLDGTSLGFSVDTKNYEHSFEEQIEKNKDNLKRLNDYINLSQDFMIRLKNASYQIAYFNTSHDYIRGFESPVIKTSIRLTKKELQSHNEKIVVPVEVGDTIYMGRFKNKKTIIKEIGEDETGMPTINKKKVVTFRTTPPKKNPNFKGYNRWKKKKKED